MDEIEKLQESIRILAKITGVSVEEAARRVRQAIQQIQESVKDCVEKLDQIFERIRGSGFSDIGPSAQLNRKNRERSRSIEQAYKTELKRIQREKTFRRIYKPPRRIRGKQGI